MANLSTCAGSLAVRGRNARLHLVRSAGDGSRLSPDRSTVELRLAPRPPSAHYNRGGSRVYGADRCEGSRYSPGEYAAWRLVGKTLSFTVDLSGCACGCVVAVYLVPLRGRTAPGTCGGDFYCDAMRVCGEFCTEIDVMEASSHTFLSTFHGDLVGGECFGRGTGLGGPHAAFDPASYGPGGANIDTRRPFRVAATFEADGNRSTLRRMSMTLAQVGKPPLSFAPPVPAHCLARHAAALRGGVTPVISYWAADNLSWFDPPTVCQRGEQDACAETARVGHLRVVPAKPHPPGGGAAGCTDEAGWRNGDRPGGSLSCTDYGTRFCAGGRFRPGSEWASGEGFRYPERACCACGGGGGGSGRRAARVGVHSRRVSRQPGTVSR